MIGRDADRLADRGDATGTGSRRLGVGQRASGILVEQFTGRDKVTCDGIGCRAVQRGQLGAHIRSELPRLDGGGNGGTARLPGASLPSEDGASAGGRGWARRARSGPERRGAEPADRLCRPDPSRPGPSRQGAAPGDRPCRHFYPHPSDRGYGQRVSTDNSASNSRAAIVEPQVSGIWPTI